MMKLDNLLYILISNGRDRFNTTLLFLSIRKSCFFCKNRSNKVLFGYIFRGLSNNEAKSRLAKYGTNELEKEEKESIWEKIKEQFEDNLVRILLLAAVISFVISQFEDHEEIHAVPPWVEPCVIFTILILNAAVGIW